MVMLAGKLVCTVTLRTEEEVWIVRFTAQTAESAVMYVAKWAIDPECTFTWQNALDMSQQIAECYEVLASHETSS